MLCGLLEGKTSFDEATTLRCFCGLMGAEQAPEIPRTLWINLIQENTTLLQGVICNS